MPKCLSKSEKELQLSIADITLKIKEAAMPQGFSGFQLPDPLGLFQSQQDPDAIYQIYSGIPSKISFGEKTFDSGGIWQLYQNNGNNIITLESPTLGKEPYEVAFLTKDFTGGDIYINEEISLKSQLHYPLTYPLDELLMINLLCQGRGIEVHACGVIDDGKGIAFLGVSGAGKSTLANLWKSHPEVAILSDDRVIIRKEKEKFWVYGTPWHGDARAASPGKAPLERLYFITHAPKNYAAALKTKEALSRLLVRCFPTFWSQEGMDFILQFGAELCSNLACFELGFVPNQTVIDFIRR